MTTPIAVTFKAVDLVEVASAPGLVAIFVDEKGKMDAGARKANSLSRKALSRYVESDAFEKAAVGHAAMVSYPVGMAATGVVVIKLGRRPTSLQARKAGVNLSKLMAKQDVLVLAGGIGRPEEIALGLTLRTYKFDTHQTDEKTDNGTVTFMVNKPEDVAKAGETVAAIAEGVFFTRDLTSEPANVLTTTNFADRLAQMRGLGLDVEVLEEADLEKLGMRTLLSVGQGSASPSKVVVMSWKGGGDEAPFALVGKGVVFDTGGISLKSPAGMETMTMDMGGAGVVGGVMRTLALRKAKANVVGLVGIVENMPSGTATRPGDVVKSMKGETVEIINTDAEGRLVLADVLWYAQERFKPSGMINLATLTGAIIVSLGHQNAGVFSNSDALSADFIKAAEAEGEGAWRMPLAPAYDKLIKSKIADIKNTGGRNAGSITAAQFLKRFVEDDVPWCHLDIAGVASVPSETAYAAPGITGWGVMALNRLIVDKYEG